MRQWIKNMADDINDASKRSVSDGNKGIGCDLGTITSRNELKLDAFSYPLSSYLISDHLVDDGSSSLSALAPGDRVLVALVNKGQDHVVVARVMPYG